jgi:choice-of-anchor B domain-containing protein
MKAKLRLFFLLCIPISSFGQPVEATMSGYWHDESLIPAFFSNPYHDVWGTVINGREIGIISSTSGFHFFDLSAESTSLEPVAFVPGTVQGSQISHRDFKAYLHYLYAVADEGQSALQIIDLSGLPEQATLVYESNQFITRTHNIFIDQDNARLYATGGTGFSLRILSLADPENPTLLATFPNSTLNLPYVHDCYVRGNIAYLNVGFNGLWVVDFTDPADPVLLGTMTSYLQQGYNHSGWLSDDGNYYYMCDETHGSDVKVVDVSDFSDMEVVATMNPASTPNQIPHNVYLKDNLLYVSYYYDGLQVFDVSNPLFPRRVAYYDTCPLPNTSYFAGAWGVFVLPSGRPLISDMNNGFYVFEPIPDLEDFSITPSSSSIQVCEGQAILFSILVGADFEGGEVILSTENTSDGIEVELSSYSASPGEVVGVIVIGAQAGAHELAITATDGVNEGQSSIPILVEGLPAPVVLQTPTNGRMNVALTPLFIWNGGAEAVSKRFELSTDSIDFEAHIVYSAVVVNNNLFFPTTLEEGTTYYWRIAATYGCGQNTSQIFSFTTRVITGLDEIPGNAFHIYPNPASDEVFLTFERPLGEDLRVEWMTAGGQALRIDRIGHSAQLVRLPVAGFPAGVYLVRLSTAGTSVVRRIVVQ